MDESFGTDAIFHVLLVLVMTGTTHEMLAKFLKLKPPVFTILRMKINLSSSWTVTKGFTSWASCINIGLSL